MRCSITVKGSETEAIKAAEAHKVPVEKTHGIMPDSVTLIVDSDAGVLNAWFLETIRNPPFPVGTLTYWRPL